MFFDRYDWNRLLETHENAYVVMAVARGARALPERPAAQGAATGLCVFQSAVRISPAVCDAGSIAKSSWFVVGDSWLVRVPLS